MSFPFYAIFPTQISKKCSIVLCYCTTSLIQILIKLLQKHETTTKQRPLLVKIIAQNKRSFSGQNKTNKMLVVDTGAFEKEHLRVLCRSVAWERQWVPVLQLRSKWITSPRSQQCTMDSTIPLCSKTTFPWLSSMFF